ncbi:MAG: thioredoxin [Bacteroidales bacterium]|jgi:thioredoxin 1|nr:thioredoxin [Bacteroidales bacterium]
MKSIKLFVIVFLPLMIGAVVSSCASTDGENGDVVVIESSEQFYELIEGDTPILVDFYADWCRPCRIQGPIVEELATEMPGKVIVAKLDVDKFPRISSKYQVTGIPSIILYQKGEQIWKKVGLQQKPGLKAAIDAHLKSKS